MANAHMAIMTIVGVLGNSTQADPLGLWGPLGSLQLGGDEGDATFNTRREAAIKHGRVSMHTTVMPEYFKYPGFLSFATGLAAPGLSNGPAARSKVHVQGGAQFVLFAGLVEASGLFSGKSKSTSLGLSLIHI